jgi:transcriptional regulator with XRE-family HTH domain
MGREEITSFGELIAEGRKRAKLTQRELAARIRLEDGRPISAPYLNDLEHNLRRAPRGHLIEQFARELGLEADVLYYAAKRVPIDIGEGATRDQALAAWRAFRKEIKGKRKKK